MSDQWFSTYVAYENRAERLNQVTKIFNDQVERSGRGELERSPAQALPDVGSEAEAAHE
jgi:hypothetical protein